MNSPHSPISDVGHMHQLLAPTYDSCDVNGSTIGASVSSINTSDDIDVSLNDLKKFCEVNAEDLEKSREVLEADEVTGGKSMATSIDTGGDDEMVFTRRGC
jgi:hypothetical protein